MSQKQTNKLTEKRDKICSYQGCNTQDATHHMLNVTNPAVFFIKRINPKSSHCKEKIIFFSTSLILYL